MKKYFTVFLAFIIYFNVFSQAHAAKNYNVKTITYDPLERVINATILDQIAEKTMQKTAKVPVTSYATGSTVAAMIRMGIAGAAIYGLVQGVGWVIENGVVKKPVDNGQINTEYYWISNTTWSDGSQICKTPTKFSTGDPAVNEFKSCAIQNRLKDPSCAMNNFEQYKCKAYNQNGYVLDWFTVDRIKNQNYDPNQTLVPVSETELGDKVNNSPQAPQILPDVYNPNNPVGGKAPESTSDALDRAVPTPETEPTGGTKPKPNKDTNGDGIPDTYDPSLPSAGEEFQLPAFCEWATTMCAWYEKYQDDSKKTDQHRELEKDVWKQEKQHRDDEKSFWEKVTDWFDWTKEEPEKEEEPERPEIDDQGIFSRTFDTVFSLSKQCPPDLPWSIDAYYFKGSYTINLNWLCMIFTFLGYPLQLLSHCIGLWIMYEAVIRKEIKW
ncbi:hypothetical protein ABFP33_18470 [Acinetobacter bereziniae]|uniref:hypothetical protein n=1 Tax=Acinetobacter bereziniae TaxID=106648 RepID=UPI0032133A3C